MMEGSGLDVAFQAQPLRDVYFSPGLVDDVRKGNIFYIQALLIAGICIVLIAGVNYINVLLTLSTQRLKEIRLKKIFGISRRQLFLQSATESLCLTVLVSLFATCMVNLLENTYVAYTGFHSLQGISVIHCVWFIPILVFLLGLLGTGYSSLPLSFSHVAVYQESTLAKRLKNTLLAIQYGIAAVILTFTFAMGKQLAFIAQKDLGFSKDKLLIVDLPEDESLAKTHIQYREKLKRLASIEQVSLLGGGALPGDENGKDVFQVLVDGKKTEKVYNIYRIDEHYLEALNIQLYAGRNFDPNQKNDQKSSVIINESLAKSLGWTSPLGKKIHYGDDTREVIGVVKNFHNKSLHNLIEPIVFLYDTQYSNHVLIKASTKEVDIIRASWMEFYPQVPFSLRYFDQFIGAMYTQEKQLSAVFRFFSLVALIMCATGLFALFSLHVLHKTREMGIRKVLGASAFNLLKVITQQFRNSILLALIISIPITWWLIQQWLEGFQYRINIGPEVYLVAGFAMIFASVVVIGYHILRVVRINPVEVLKDE